MIAYSDYLKYLIEPLSENQIQKAVLKIKDRFTLNRDHIQEYVLNPQEVSAYTAFYGYSNLFKLKEIMKWIPKEVEEELAKASLIDMGSGPGVFSLAWCDYFKESKDVTLIDSSPFMLKQAIKMMEAFYPDVRVQTKLKKESNQIMLFGHSYNEIGFEESLKLIQKINPKFIFLIEPGTKDVFQEILKLRTSLLENDYHIVFPCLKEKNCPLKEQDKDWCHQYLNVRFDLDYERLCQKLKIDRKKMPVSVHLYQKKKDVKAQNLMRIIRVYKENKFAFEFDLCEGEKVFKFQVMKKHYKKAEQKKLAQFHSGDLVQIEVEKELSLNIKRGKIIF